MGMFQKIVPLTTTPLPPFIKGEGGLIFEKICIMPILHNKPLEATVEYGNRFK